MARALWIRLPNLKFVALSVPEIIEGTQKIWAVPVYAHGPFSPKFLILWIYLPHLTFVALPIPEIIGVLQKFGESLDSPTLPILPNF